MEEYQVYRITPEKDKYYVTAEYTRRIGPWRNEIYFTTFKPRYVGKYFKEFSSGHGDGKQTAYYFYNDQINKLNTVYEAYEGTTSFIEVDSIQLVNDRYRILNLAKMMLCDSELCLNLQDQPNILTIINQHLNKIYLNNYEHFFKNIEN